MAEMRKVLAAAVERAGGIRAFARRAGLESHSSIRLMITGEREISEAVGNACGAFREVVWRIGGPVSETNLTTLDVYRQAMEA
jgi:hypothetical protein